MKIYIAHNYAARLTLRTVVNRLTDRGHEVTSSWITDDSHDNTHNKKASALIDLVDLDRAEVLVYFTDQFGDRPGKGKHFEFGYAYAKGKRIIMFGHDMSNVFTALPTLEHVSSLEELYACLKPRIVFTNEDLMRPRRE